MKRILATGLVGAMLLMPTLAGAAELKSLRDGAIDGGDKSIEMIKQATQEGGFQRSWKEAPPQIPHKIDRDQITLRDNSCIRCHSNENAEREKAPKMAESHFIDASGKKLDTLNMRRWFCTQCHVPQLETKPLVDNAFSGQPVKR